MISVEKLLTSIQFSLHLQGKIWGFLPRSRIATLNNRGFSLGDKVNLMNFKVFDSPPISLVSEMKVIYTAMADI